MRMEPTPGPPHRRVYVQTVFDAKGKQLVYFEVDEKGMVAATAEAMDWLLQLAGFELRREELHGHPQS